MRINPKQNQPIKISNIELEDVNKFVYLGATISQQCEGLEDIKGRVSKSNISHYKT